MTTDAALLRRFIVDRSESAFAELVRRHLPVVYAAAIRRLGGDEHRARDVAQIVFTQLARQAPSLLTHSSLLGWLYTTTRNTAARIIRDELRRKARDQEAHAMMTHADRPSHAADWDRIRPALDDALAQLNAADREAILMRFFGGLSFDDIGGIQSLSQDAARMRVNRALDRLRSRLIRLGVTSTAAALAEALGAQASSAAPVELYAAVTQTALVGAAVPVSAPFPIIMSSTSSKIAGAVALIGLGLAVWQYVANRQLIRETASLAQDGQAIALLRAENLRLSGLARRSPPTESAIAGPPSSPPPGAAQGSAAWADPRQPFSATETVRIASDGLVTWNGERVTLRELTNRLKNYQELHPDTNEQLLIDAHGAAGSEVSWLFNEARKAGIRNAWFAPGSQPPAP
jgi:RNA polymerase sigma factor (sigma-70 family)